MALLETHHYRLADRSMVVGLFDKSVLRHIVFGEESADEDDGRGVSLAVPPPLVPPRAAGRARVQTPVEINVDDSDEDEDDDDGSEEEDSSGDEQRTERQRSISDPSEVHRDRAR